jgi:hypothetical protein
LLEEAEMAGTTADRPDHSGPPWRADHPDGQEPDAVRGAARRRVNASPWNLLLLVPLVGVLIPSFYNKLDPTLGDMPYFYWYQLMWIPISVVLTIVVYRATRGER